MLSENVPLSGAAEFKPLPPLPNRPAALLLFFEVLLMFGPLVILGSAIGWPANLDEPASVNLPALAANYPAVLWGYGLYLAYSLLFWPMAYLTGKIAGGDNVNKNIFNIACGFAALSVLARALGIGRWLFGMPELARLYENSPPEGRQSIKIVYETLNAYAGGVGEQLGVSLFAAIWLFLIGILMLRSDALPKWLGYTAFAAALFLSINLIEIAGIDPGPFISVSVGVFHLWMLAAAFVFLTKQAKRPPKFDNRDRRNR